MRRFALLALAAAAATIAAPALASPHRGHAAPAALSPAARQALAPILADPRRAEDRARDAWRHPAETLAFFRVEPGMTVVDYMPASGWWTRILAPYLSGQGHYVGINPDATAMADRMKQMFGNLAQTFPAQAAGWTGLPAATIAGYNTDGLPAAMNGTVDRVLIFREMHNIWRMNLMHRELTAMRRLLKPEGLLGIEQHRAKPDALADYTNGTKGYLREKDVIAMVEAHGFALVGKSEINANPADPANHANGVWVLPPTFRDGDKDRARLTAIGESDRMTLLFRKRP